MRKERFVILNDVSFDVVIVGGGFSGTMLAIQLIRRAPGLSVAVVDKSPIPGRGVAYGTKYLCHLLNVPAGGMSALPDEPDHFVDWARANVDAGENLDSIESSSFLPRLLYGRYVGDLLRESIERESNGKLHWIQDEVSSILQTQSERIRSKEGSRWSVELKNGRTLRAKTVVLAAGNFPPANLRIPGLTAESKRYLRSPWLGTVLNDIPKNGSVLLIGSGLTSIDIVVALQSEGFAGHIHVLSRRGLIPQSHRAMGQWPEFWNERGPRTMRELLQLVREQVRLAAEAGCDWREVVDALRPASHDIWQSLPIAERKRFIRHVRPYWDVHRHRVATEIGETIATLMRHGRVTLYAGRIISYREDQDTGQVDVGIRERKSRSERTLRVDRVINCTGPESDCRRIDHPLMKNLLSQGLVRPDALALGLDVDSNGALMDSDGVPSSCLYGIGSVRKGYVWETVAVPEIRIQAAELATHIGQTLQEETG